MSSPFEFSRRPAFARAPPHIILPPRISRPPQHNPYDKFTQPEFDAWIGGITGALKRALGQEDEIVPERADGLPQPGMSYSSDEEEVERLVDFDGESSEEDVEEPFLPSTVRRVSKGKARDPRDGPGFGKGDQSEPIVIGSDSEEEEEEEELENEEWDEVSQSEEDGGLEPYWEEAESSVQARLRHEKQTVVEEQEDEEDEQSGEGEEDDYDTPSPKQASCPVLLVSSDEEDNEVEDVTLQTHVLDDEESDIELSDEHGPAPSIPTSNCIGSPRYREKFQVQHRLSPHDVEEVDEIQGENDLQPLDDDTSFPPHDTATNLRTDIQIEFQDPWSGPNTYAEDYYSGGDAVGKLQTVTADKLSENDEVPDQLAHIDNQQEDVIDVDAGEPDQVQPLSEDTSFPPGDHIDLEYPPEIPDQWAGPKTYAEDYYSGGDVRRLESGTPNAHHMGEYDEVVTPASTANSEIQNQPGQEFDELAIAAEQGPQYQNSSIIPDNVVPKSPQIDNTDISEPWDGPITYDDEDSRELGVHSQSESIPSGNNGVTPIIIDSEDESETVKGTGEAGVEVKPVQQHVPVSDSHHTSLESPGSVDVSDGLPAVQPDASKFLYDDIAEIQGFETVFDENQPDDLSAINWMYDYTYHDMSVGSAIDQSLSRPSATDLPPSRLNGHVAECLECSDHAVNDQSPGSPFSLSNGASSETELDHGTKDTSDAPNIYIEATSVSLDAAGHAPFASSFGHTNEEDSLSTSVLNITEPQDAGEVMFDIVVRDVSIAPEIEEVEESEPREDVATHIQEELDLDLDAASNFLNEILTQETIVEPIEVLDEAATLVEIGSKESDADINTSTPVHVELSEEAEPNLSTPEINLTITSAAIGVDNGDVDAPDTPGSQALPQETLLPDSVNLTTHAPSSSTSTSNDVVDNANSAEISEQSHITVLESSIGPDFPQILPSRITREEILHEDTSHKEYDGDDIIHLKRTSASVDGDNQVSAAPQMDEVWPRSPSTLSKAPTLMGTIDSPHAKLWSDSYPMKVFMRKTTDPVLFADPYPASLSTPHDSFAHTNQKYAGTYEPYDKISQNSLSSLTDKDEEGSARSSASKGSTQMVQHSAVQPCSPMKAASAWQNPEVLHDSTGKDVGDDLKPHSDALMSPSSPSLPVQSVGKDLAEMAHQSSIPSSQVVERTDGVLATRVRSPPLEDDLPSILIIRKVHADDQTPAKPKVGRPPKRKRSLSVATPPVARSSSMKKLQKTKSSSRLAKPQGSDAKITRKSSIVDKGKGREVGVPLSQASLDMQSISSRSGSDASATRRMLNPGSRGTSRASSIASNSPSDHSISTVQPSPTLGKGNSFRQQALPPPPPPPLLHRHHHNRPGPLQTSRAGVATKTVSSNRQAGDPQSLESPVTKSSASSSHRHPVNFSSPVTRSNCRYHKISIPLDDDSDDEDGDEDVKLVYFLVPGCSLGNMELNRDEKIVDHGDALPQDGLLMTPDLDAYAFNAPLLSVLRLLVGVDMLREGEIFYLPQPGSDWVPRKRDTPTKAHGPIEPGLPDISPRRNSSVLISTPVASTSGTGSASASATLRLIKPSSTISHASSDLTEIEDSPQSKRLRFSPVDEKHFTGGLESDLHSKQLKRFGQDTADKLLRYEEQSSADEHSPEERARKGLKHGIKRSRTSDIVREPNTDGQNLKRQKTGPDLQTT